MVAVAVFERAVVLLVVVRLTAVVLAVLTIPLALA